MQRTKSKILSILLSLVMLLSLLPTTALAAGTYHPKANEVSVDDGKYFAEPGAYYFRNGEDKCSKDSKGSNATYNPTTGTLTLDGYKGGSIMAGGTKSKITVVLKGTNIINNGSLTSAWGGDITITSSSGGTLSISKIMDYSGAATGIETGYGSQTTGNVTIEGSAEVTIKMTHNGTSTYEKAYGIFARENITISGDASVNIICATPKNTTGGDYCNGLYAARNVSIDTNGTIMIDVTDAGKDENNGYSFGVFPMGTATLTKVGNMEVNWKKVANNSNYPGGAFKGKASIDPGTHAVNEDTTNCYASYRKGKPYTVTVVNGDLAGPGVVPYAKNDGEFLAGDKVNIKPGEMKSNDGTLIPFKEWTAEGVTFDSPAAMASNSFTVPNKNVTVTAKHSPFVGTPVFKSTSGSSGTIEFKTVAKPDNSEFFQYVKDGDEDNQYGYYRPYNTLKTTSTESPYRYSASATDWNSGDIQYLEAGEYRMAVTLNNERYLSDKFTVNYTEPAANISVSQTGTMDFGEVKAGYTTVPAAKTVTITNSGTADTGALTIALKGSNATSFTVSTNNIANVAANGGTETFTVQPNTGLSAGIYNATVKVSGAGVTEQSFNVQFTVKGVTSSLIGDVNGDGTIDATDMQRIYAHISRENTFSNLAQGDVNKDGNVDATDMQRIYAHISRENPLS